MLMRRCLQAMPERKAPVRGAGRTTNTGGIRQLPHRQPLEHYTPKRKNASGDFLEESGQRGRCKEKRVQEWWMVETLRLHSEQARLPLSELWRGSRGENGGPSTALRASKPPQSKDPTCKHGPWGTLWKKSFQLHVFSCTLSVVSFGEEGWKLERGE